MKELKNILIVEDTDLAHLDKIDELKYIGADNIENRYKFMRSDLCLYNGKNGVSIIKNRYGVRKGEIKSNDITGSEMIKYLFY